MSSTIDPKKYAVLYVDDEEQALKYFKRGLDRDFRVLTAIDVASALTVLEKEGADIAVVITDYRMPGRNGVSLLGEVRQRWPHCVRILTTAYSEVDNAIEAVNSGAIYKYLTKPVDFNLLRETLRKALDSFLANSTRETLLEIKMSELRRMIVADRVQTFANLTRGIAHHLRNSMTAVSCLFEELPSLDGSTPASDYNRELWSLASAEHTRLVDMLQAVQQASITPTYDISTAVELPQLLTAALQRSGLDAARVTVELTSPAPTLTLDSERGIDLIATLLRHVDRLCQPGAAITCATTAATTMGSTPAARLQLKGAGAAWTDEDVSTFFTPFAFPKHDPSEIGLGLLSAFFTVSAHGGDLIVHRDAPLGPGFELVLPLDARTIDRESLNPNLLTTLFADEIAPPAPADVAPLLRKSA